MDRPYEFIYFIDFPIDNSVPMVIVVAIAYWSLSDLSDIPRAYRDNSR